MTEYLERYRLQLMTSAISVSRTIFGFQTLQTSPPVVWLRCNTKGQQTVTTITTKNFKQTTMATREVFRQLSASRGTSQVWKKKQGWWLFLVEPSETLFAGFILPYYVEMEVVRFGSNAICILPRLTPSTTKQRELSGTSRSITHAARQCRRSCCSW